MKPLLCSWNCFNPFPEKKGQWLQWPTVSTPRTEGSSCCSSSREPWSLFCQAWAWLYQGSQSSLCSCASAQGCNHTSGRVKAALSPSSTQRHPCEVPEQLFNQVSFFQRLHVNSTNPGVSPCPSSDRGTAEPCVPSGSRLLSWQTAMAKIPSAQNSTLTAPLLQNRRTLSSL